MLRVALIGCGKIADQHIAAMQRIGESKVVAVCDREFLMAEQLAERFGIAGRYGDADQMLASASFDVVHITTPPQSHCELAQRCLAAGSHVYLEKPFTVAAAEAELLIGIAQSAGLSITAGHNYQFTPEMLEMRSLVDQGYLGGSVVHMESYWSYDLGDTSYVGPVLGSPDHWVRRLPGKLFHNLISHGVARLAEFLDDDLAQVIATAHQSAYLRGFDASDVMDELRVLIRDAKGTTATFCFSTQIKPGLNELRLYGPSNSLSVDATSGTLIKCEGSSHRSYLAFLVPPMKAARNHAVNATRNFAAIVRRRLYHDSGMGELVRRFHKSVAHGGPPPIPYREILLTARIMDSVFAQIRQE